MNLKIVDNYSRRFPTRRRLHCGPAALAAIAGIPAQTAVLICVALSGSPNDAAWWHLSRALFAFGWRIEIDDFASGTLMSELKPLCLVIVQCPDMTHYVVVENGMMVDSRNHEPIKITPKRDKPALHVWRILKLAHNEPVLYNRF